MAGLLRNIFGLNDGGNNGTIDAFNNKGGGKQDFDEAKFKTGAKVTNGGYTNLLNNGTKNAFNNSNGGTQKFGKAKFDTGARIGN
ncbi:hypothetical protein P8452_38784 [Trifolium repens]|jgi:hypothetical protein|nr:hypothetical protein QL285_071152 [Trifolium repens]WJX52695.1 hypothetical protein P8452_38781 [Trifolium repens]WJX52698.1 hypothetical protein P8452_38783 [Trifolium repens]WJX52699.1 hypothetical protein P8452_38784 [Trifolium repens]